MTRGDMRGVLRAQLKDEGGSPTFSDTRLNTYLSEGLHLVQKEVMKVAPEAFVSWYTQDITANNEFYAAPAGFWYELRVEVLDTTDNKYKKIGKLPLDFFETRTSSAATVYTRKGRWILLNPTPAAAINDGLRLIFVPTLGMSADTDTPDLHPGLHMAMVLWAKKIATGEDDETNEATDRDLAALLADIPMYYLSGGDTEKFWISPSTLGKVSI